MFLQTETVYNTIDWLNYEICICIKTENRIYLTAALFFNFGDFRCVALPDNLAFYFAETFQVVPPNTKGETWCIRTGTMDAAKFEVIGGSSKIWLGCTYNFCTLPDETLCDYVSLNIIIRR